MSYAHRWIIGIFIFFAFFSIGFLLTEMKDKRKSKTHFTNFPDSKNFVAVLEDSPKGRDGNYRAVVNVVSIINDSNFVPAKGRCYVYFKNDSVSGQLLPGDKIVFNGKVNLISAPLNPGQFDFQYRSSIHRIYNQVYLRNYEWKKITSECGSSLKRLSVRLRDKFLNMYKGAGLSGQEYAVLSALVLGYDDEIDRDIMSAFSASGTLHVLSVSGMHVGIIFTALSSMLVFLERKKSLRIIRLFILLVALWFYAMLTGLSPSVIRSAMMFSFILIGQSLNRSSNIYNSLALSALCIFIFFDPLMLFEVGLQLSFLAVGGIAFLYPKVYKWFFVKNKWLDKVWALVAVSIAAQAATFAVSIYYFHMFPNYFIPANLIIIPISTVGIFAGIILLFISPFKFIYVKAGWLVHQIVYWLNASAVFILELPGSVWSEIKINIFDLIIIYSFFFALIYFFEKRSIMYLYALLIFCSLLLSSTIIGDYIEGRNKNLVIYSNTTSLCCQFNIQNKSILLYHSVDSVIAIKYSDGYNTSVGLKKSDRTLICLDSVQQTDKVFVSGNYIVFNKYLILDLSVNLGSDVFKEKLPVDLIYLNRTSLKRFIQDRVEGIEVVLNDKGIYENQLQRLNDIPISFSRLSKGARIINLN